MYQARLPPSFGGSALCTLGDRGDRIICRRYPTYVVETRQIPPMHIICLANMKGCGIISCRVTSHRMQCHHASVDSWYTSSHDSLSPMFDTTLTLVCLASMSPGKFALRSHIAFSNQLVHCRFPGTLRRCYFTPPTNSSRFCSSRGFPVRIASQLLHFVTSCQRSLVFS